MEEDYITRLIDENYNVRKVTLLKDEDYAKKCYYLGFLDGYMKEEIYNSLITKDIGKISYEKGYQRGEGARERSTTKEINRKKEYFISRYAFFDVMNGVDNNIFSDKFKDMYDSFSQGEYDFKSGKYTSKSKK